LKLTAKQKFQNDSLRVVFFKLQLKIWRCHPSPPFTRVKNLQKIEKKNISELLEKWFQKSKCEKNIIRH